MISAYRKFRTICIVSSCETKCSSYFRLCSSLLRPQCYTKPSLTFIFCLYVSSTLVSPPLVCQNQYLVLFRLIPVSRISTRTWSKRAMSYNWTEKQTWNDYTTEYIQRLIYAEHVQSNIVCRHTLSFAIFGYTLDTDNIAKCMQSASRCQRNFITAINFKVIVILCMNTH